MPKPRKPAPSARTGGLADLMAGDPNEIKEELKREAPCPQGAGGTDPAGETKKEKARTKRRLTRSCVSGLPAASA